MYLLMHPEVDNSEQLITFPATIGNEHQWSS